MIGIKWSKWSSTFLFFFLRLKLNLRRKGSWLADEERELLWFFLSSLLWSWSDSPKKLSSATDFGIGKTINWKHTLLLHSCFSNWRNEPIPIIVATVLSAIRKDYSCSASCFKRIALFSDSFCFLALVSGTGLASYRPLDLRLS